MKITSAIHRMYYEKHHCIDIMISTRKQPPSKFTLTSEPMIVTDYLMKLLFYIIIFSHENLLKMHNNVSPRSIIKLCQIRYYIIIILLIFIIKYVKKKNQLFLHSFQDVRRKRLNDLKYLFKNTNCIIIYLHVITQNGITLP